MRTNRFLTKLGIMCIALTDIDVGAVTPALASIGKAFPGTPFSTIQLIAAIPGLFLGLIPALLYAPLARFMKKRSILYIGVALSLIGGLGPAWLHSNVTIILVLRGLLGIGTGLLTPMGIDLIYDFFEGHEQRTVIGWNGATMGLGGILFQVAGGFLCQIRWDYTFYAYAIAGLFFTVAIMFLPEPEKKVKPDTQKPKEKMPFAIYLYVAVIFFNGMCFYSSITNAAYILVGEKIAQPDQIGIMFGVLTLASVIIGLLFGQAFKVFKYYILTLSLICGVAGMFICYTTTSFALFTLGMFLIGFTLGGSTSAVWAKIGHLVPLSLSGLGIGLGISAINLGEFFQPVVFNLFTVPGRQPLLISAIGFLVLAVLTVILEKSYPAVTKNERNA